MIMIHQCFQNYLFYKRLFSFITGLYREKIYFLSCLIVKNKNVVLLISSKMCLALIFDSIEKKKTRLKINIDGHNSIKKSR